MDMFEAAVSSGFILNEQLARQIFDILPDNGPVMIIAGKDKNFWPSNSEKFLKLNIDESFLKEICDKIDDGDEPVVTHLDNCTIVAAQLSTDHTNCGYMIIVTAAPESETTTVDIGFIEIILGQINLIAKLIEKNNLLYELQMNRAIGHQNPTTLN